ncbi:phosphate acyltransferase PlsX [bacterium]|nr:phosphate acyltransferase PlsX [bacterium]
MADIILDAMGGDNAPAAQVAGAVAALDKIKADIYLAGRKDEIEKLLNGFTHSRLHILNAPDIIEMDAKPVVACRKYPDSSLMVGMRFAKERENSVFVSAGNSGAVMTAAVMVLERISGIIRPAIAVVTQGINHPFVMLDAGANTNCSWQQLCQFAVMGGICAEQLIKKSNPRIGLLSNGSESCKGTDAVVAANKALLETELNFIGNIEGNDILNGVCDCIVCDGFVGNIILKFAEGFGSALKHGMSSGSRFHLLKKIAKSVMKKIFTKFDYTEYGATYLLGLKGSVLVTHGRANEKAIMNAIIAAEGEINTGINKKISEEINKYTAVMSL